MSHGVQDEDQHYEEAGIYARIQKDNRRKNKESKKKGRKQPQPTIIVIVGVSPE